jgi:hypothetical protein
MAPCVCINIAFRLHGRIGTVAVSIQFFVPPFDGDEAVSIL